MLMNNGGRNMTEHKVSDLLTIEEPSNQKIISPVVSLYNTSSNNIENPML